MTAPDVPGSYVIRYHTGAPGYPVIASHALEVADTKATFEPIGAVEAGANVTIAWQGPGHERDFISVDAAGAADRQYGPYQYARSTPVTIRAPDAAGEYVVRYHLATTYRVIGQATLTVGAVDASITSPGEARAGAEIEIVWRARTVRATSSASTARVPASAIMASTRTRARAVRSASASPSNPAGTSSAITPARRMPCSAARR
jgi:hypothetical protein